MKFFLLLMQLELQKTCKCSTVVASFSMPAIKNIYRTCKIAKLSKMFAVQQVESFCSSIDRFIAPINVSIARSLAICKWMAFVLKQKNTTTQVLLFLLYVLCSVSIKDHQVNGLVLLWCEVGFPFESAPSVWICNTLYNVRHLL